MAMRAPYTQLFVHLVWATWNRRPWIVDPLRRPVYECIQSECTRLKVGVLAIGGIEDHLHLLVRLPTTIAVASLVKQVKGNTAHLVNTETSKPFAFRWQGGYGAFSVSKRSVPQVRDYILRQEEHHRMGTIVPMVEPA